MIPKLPDPDRANLPTDLPLWRLLADRDAIARDFVFKDFSAAFGFMTQAALASRIAFNTGFQDKPIGLCQPAAFPGLPRI